MRGLLLVGLGEGVPVLRVGVDVGVAPNEGFLLVDPDNFDNLCPLVSDVALVVPLDNSGITSVEHRVRRRNRRGRGTFFAKVYMII